MMFNGEVKNPVIWLMMSPLGGGVVGGGVGVVVVVVVFNGGVSTGV
jgi:hypothetical protein